MYINFRLLSKFNNRNDIFQAVSEFIWQFLLGNQKFNLNFVSK